MATIAQNLETIKNGIDDIKENLGLSQNASLANVVTKSESVIEPTGTVSITENGTVDVTNYASADVNVSGGGGADLLDYFTSPMPFGSSASTAGLYTLIKKLPDNLEIGTSLRYACYKMQSLEEMPAWDTSNVTDMRNTFQGCVSLTTVKPWDTSKVITTQNMFNECVELVNVPVLDTSSITNIASMFYYCNKLSYDSIDNILQMCININPAYTGAKKLRTLLSVDNYITATIQSLPHYQAFVSAGWTIN